MSSQHDEASARAAGTPTAAGAPAAAGPTEPAFASAVRRTSQRRAASALPVLVAVAAALPLPPGCRGRPPRKARRCFAAPAPLILFWLWVAFALFNFFDVAARDHDYFSLELTAGLLAVTAVVYACTLRPRVIADADAIHVYNPYRDHVVPWGAVNGVYLGDSVELSCARPGPKSTRTIYCWALYSGRRSRLRAQLRADAPGGPRHRADPGRDRRSAAGRRGPSDGRGAGPPVDGREAARRAGRGRGEPVGVAAGGLPASSGRGAAGARPGQVAAHCGTGSPASFPPTCTGDCAASPHSPTVPRQPPPRQPWSRDSGPMAGRPHSR